MTSTDPVPAGFRSGTGSGSAPRPTIAAMTTRIDVLVTSDHGTGKQAPRDVGAGRLRHRGHRSHATLGRCSCRPVASARAIGCSTSQPARATRPCRQRSPARTCCQRPGPDSWSSEQRSPRRAAATLRLAGGRRRSTAVCRRRVRRGAVLCRRDVRPAPSAVGRRADSGLPTRRAVALISWTPEGFIGQLFATMSRYPAPPAGAQPGPCGATRLRARSVRGRRHGLPCGTQGAGGGPVC